MPCPCFEPQRAITQRTQRNVRLPLIDAYEGQCHAPERPGVPSGDVLFRFCNQGYSRGFCSYFPSGETRSALRYSIQGRSDTVLDVICIEESDHSPVRWFPLKYSLDTDALQPDPADICIATQARAFCRGYLRHLANDLRTDLNAR
jgi:hypothetical protein